MLLGCSGTRGVLGAMPLGAASVLRIGFSELRHVSVIGRSNITRVSVRVKCSFYSVLLLGNPIGK